MPERTSSSRAVRWLHPYAVVVACSTFILLVAGGLVTSTGSGLAVPDWPLSYGQLMPPMVGGVFYEHGHRMIATAVGFLTLLLTVWVWVVEGRRWVRNLALAALGAVIVQGTLGGMTVLLLLPTWVSATHATLAQAFFCLTLALAFVLSPWWEAQGRATLVGRGRGLVLLPAVVVFIQLVLGSIMRHSNAGLAVPDFPLAFGAIIPSLDDASLHRYTETLVQQNVRLWAEGPVTASQILIHLAHRYWGYVVLVTVVWYARRLFTMPVHRDRFRLLGAILASGVIVQATLGILTVLMGRPVWIATAHQSLGAFILGMTVLASLHVVRISRTGRQ